MIKWKASMRLLYFCLAFYLFSFASCAPQRLRVNAKSMAHLIQAQNCLNAEKVDEAVWESTQAIYIEPRSALAHCYRGSAYNRLGEYKKATANFTEAFALDEADICALHGRAWSHSQHGDYRHAIAAYVRLLSI